MRRNGNRAWSAPEHYHVCVNGAWLGVDGATDVGIRLERERFAEQVVSGEP